jgi:fructuronate reductase
VSASGVRRPPGAPRLSRADRRRAAAPVRHVHLGLGAFVRAHVAAYTERAPDAAEWGIAAFTGRSPTLAEQLSAQDCLYNLVVRGPRADSFSVITSLNQALPGTDAEAWRHYLAAPATAIVTLTVTEAGYRRDASGALNLADPAVRADLLAWRRGARSGGPAGLRTVPARLAVGFAARQAADAGPITLLSCDNLPGNSATAARVALDFAAAADPGVAEWMTGNVHVVDTLVDRITPATTNSDVALVERRTGRADTCPVVTEPYTEWVLTDTFGTDRPDWPSAGALITSDVRPYEERKLWLLNGAHSLLAYAAPSRGHTTVTQAIADPVVLAWVHEWWDEAAPHVSLPRSETAAYCEALLERWGNTRMRHQLAQIAAGGMQKLPVRILPVLRAELALGRVPPGAARILGSWVAYLRGNRFSIDDPDARELAAAIQQADSRSATRLALAALDPELADYPELLAVVSAASAEFGRPPTVKRSPHEDRPR